MVIRKVRALCIPFWASFYLKPAAEPHRLLYALCCTEAERMQWNQNSGWRPDDGIRTGDRSEVMMKAGVRVKLGMGLEILLWPRLWA
jgi:hypothetical protein